MLRITIPSTEFWDEVKQEFVYTKAQTLQLEHSLVSLSGRQLAVQRRVPLGGDLRLHGLQVVKARPDLPPGAEGTPRPLPAPGGHRGLPRVAQGTEPPDLSIAVG